MLKVGITGNIGSGKSTICRVFAHLGVPVFYADEQAKALFLQANIRQQIEMEFGAGVFDPGGSVNRAALAQIVFSQPDKLHQLNAIIHPAVFLKFNAWCTANQHAPYVIQEAAILFETGWHNKHDYNILVWAPEEMLIQRVMQRDQVGRQMVLERLNNQMSQEEKIQRADFVLRNDNAQLLLPEIVKLHHFFSNRKTKAV